VEFRGVRRQAGQLCDLSEGFALLRQFDALALAVGEVNIRRDVPDAEIFADARVKLVSDCLKRL
jgi:hypothetical protein